MQQKITELVRKYDTQNQFEVLINTYKQVEFAWNNKFDLSPLKNKKFTNVLVTGLGGSAISGDLLQNFLRDELKLPFIVNRNYSLPAFAGAETLLIVSSYSGNTEETISVFQQGIDKNCNIVCISTGGKVEAISNEKNIPLVKVQKGFQPRYALGLGFFSLLKIFQELNLIPDQNEIVNKIISLWKKKGVEFSAENNSAINTAESLIGYVPVIYSAADMTSAVGYRLKSQFNENSKLHAFHNIIPEQNHNEIVGWESFNDSQFQAKLINILDKDYHPQVSKRFKIVSELVAAKKLEIINLTSDEDELKLRIMDLVYLGDWISYYLAVMRGYDPTEIDNINYLKNNLNNA